jgi:hypothetical protein
VSIVVRIETIGTDAVTTAEEVYSAADGRLTARATCVLRAPDAALAALRASGEAPAQNG